MRIGQTWPCFQTAIIPQSPGKGSKMIDPKLTELAEKLGAEMAASKTVEDFKRFRREMLADAEAHGLLKAYQDHVAALARKEHEGKPIEVEDKHKLRELREKTYRNDKLKALLAAEADYVEMVEQVNNILGRHLSAGEEGKK